MIAAGLLRLLRCIDFFGIASTALIATGSKYFVDLSPIHRISTSKQTLVDRSLWILKDTRLSGWKVLGPFLPYGAALPYFTLIQPVLYLFPGKFHFNVIIFKN